MNLSRPAEALRRYDAAQDRTDELAEAAGVAYGPDAVDINDPEVCQRCVRPGLSDASGGATDLSFARRMVLRCGGVES